MSGYPEQYVVKRKEKSQSRFYCYSMEGAIEHVAEGDNGLIVGHSIDCSPGQDGGPLTLKDGTLVGVYSNVEEYAND